MRPASVAVVTGASRGVGLVVAEALAQAGARVATVARSGGASLPGGIALSADVSRLEEVERVRAEVLERLGPPSILVNAAGVFGELAPTSATDPARWLETVEVNLFGPYLTCRVFLGGMLEAGFGRIVNVTSANSLHPPGPLGAAYSTSKAALNHFTRCLAAELEGTGVTANVFHPGDIRTEMWADIREQAGALGPAGAPYLQWCDWVAETGGDPLERSARLVLGLCGDDAAGVNGRFLWIEDGLQPPSESWGEPAGRLPWEA